MKLKTQMFLSLLAAGCLALALPAIGRSQVGNNFTQLYSFNGSGGGGLGPNGRVLISPDGSTLYGTTYNGGDANNDGTVYELKLGKHSNTEAVIHTFSGSDGSHPAAGLVMGSNNVLYGTTAAGGTSGNGVVFQLTPPTAGSSTWGYETIYSFRGSPSDGSGPNCDLLLVSSLSSTILYGTTVRGGGYDEGTAFSLTLTNTGWEPKVLFSFNGTFGVRPYSELVIDSNFNLYGTTGTGGSNSFGTVFMLTPQSSGYKSTTLWTFDGPDGKFPLAGVYLDPSGNIFGTTYVGGGNSYGGVYELVPKSPGSPATTYSESVIYSFTDGLDGANPSDVLTPDGSGGFYTTTGGARAGVNGSVIHLVPPISPSTSWTSTTLYSFSGGTDGQAPLASVVLDPVRMILYGTAFYGGAYGGGSVFKLQ